MDQKEIVRAGYDRVSHAFREFAEENDHLYQEWINELASLLPDGGRALDLGCGIGIPAAEFLSEHFKTTGVDISEEQITRAREYVPEAEFLCTDMCGLEFEDGSFDAITSFYAIIHVPLDEQAALFANIYRWLRPGGYALLMTGNRAWIGTEEDWLGVEGALMAWSHEGKGYYEELAASTGFEVVRYQFVPEGEGGHAWFLLRKPC